MVAQSKIEWTHHTFNPWWGCVRVSPGCEKCYAEAFSKRTGNAVWGVQAPRRFFGDKHWNEPNRRNERCAKAGARERVFCASMADVFEDRPDLVPHRDRLWRTIGATPWLDWLLLTKRPENVDRLGHDVLGRCWLGTTAEDQRRADERIPLLLQCPAAVRFVSAEPLLGPVDFRNMLVDSQSSANVLTGRWTGDDITKICPRVDWVIVGSESGPGARPMARDWARSVVDQCTDSGCAVFTKQIANPFDRKGGDPLHWPAGNWPREFPDAAARGKGG